MTVGVQTWYGITGPVTGLGDHPRFDLPRTRKKSPLLQLLPGSLKEIQPEFPQQDTATERPRFHQLPSIYYPRSIIEQRERTLKPIKTYDPTFGSLIAVGKARDTSVVVSVSGSSHDTVVIGVGGSNYAVKVKEEVKQVDVIPDMAISVLVMVRTDSTIHILIVMLGNVTIKRIGQIDQAQIAGLPLANATCSCSSVGVVDVMGNFGFFEFKKRGAAYKRIAQVPLAYATFHEPTELSYFHKMVISCHKLYLMGRTSLHEYNMETGKMRCRIIAGAWSKLLDLIPLVDKYFLLLTTKEVVVVDTSHGFKRALAWKHDLLDSDTTWHFSSVLPFDSGHLCLISSKLANFTYALELTPQKIINVPYYVITSPTVMNTRAFCLEAKGVLCYQITDNLAVSRCELKWSDGISKPIQTDQQPKRTSIKLHRINVKAPATVKPFARSDYVRCLPECGQPQEGLSLESHNHMWVSPFKLDISHDDVVKFFDKLPSKSSKQVLDLLLPSLVTVSRENPDLESFSLVTNELIAGLPDNVAKMVGSFEQDIGALQGGTAIDNRFRASQVSAPVISLSKRSQRSQRSQRTQRSPRKSQNSQLSVQSQHPAKPQRVVSQPGRHSQRSQSGFGGSQRHSQKRKKRKTGFI